MAKRKAEGNRIKAKIEKGRLIISLPVQPDGTVSKSGKSIVIATTNGFATTDLIVEGEPVKIGLNAIIPV